MIYTYKLMFYYWRMFGIFRDTCSIYYGLDPVDDYTLPNFAFDAMLKLRPSILLYYTLPNFAFDAMPNQAYRYWNRFSF